MNTFTTYLRSLLLSLALALGLFHSAHAEPLRVVTSFSILADVVRNLGGERVQVDTIIAHDEDAHGYQPRPSDSRKLREAQVVIANGLGFDAWIERLTQASGGSGVLVIASEGARLLERSDAHHDHGHGHGHGHGHDDEHDPHLWQDVANVRLFAANIAKALIAADPAGEQAYRANLSRYDAELAALDAEIRQQLASLPAGRTVVTSHEAFAYFGAAYGVRFLAASGVSASSEPSAAGVARLIRQIRKEKAAAVFLENISDPRMMERIGKETGARVGGTLISDALSGPDGSAPTYVAMMRHNLATLLAALR